MTRRTRQKRRLTLETLERREVFAGPGMDAPVDMPNGDGGQGNEQPRIVGQPTVGGSAGTTASAMQQTADSNSSQLAQLPFEVVDQVITGLDGFAKDKVTTVGQTTTGLAGGVSEVASQVTSKAQEVSQDAVVVGSKVVTTVVEATGARGLGSDVVRKIREAADKGIQKVIKPLIGFASDLFDKATTTIKKVVNKLTPANDTTAPNLRFRGAGNSQ